MSDKTSKEVVPLTEEQLKTKEADLKIETEKLAKEKEDFAQEKKDFAKEKSDFKKSKEAIEPENISEFEFEGDSYSFSENAPQVINFAGQKFTRQELVDNEEVLLQFIGGRSSFIVKK